MKWYVKEDSLLAGMTLKNQNRAEYNNMAFHTAIDRETVIENRKLVAEAIEQPLTSFVCAAQTHSANFYEVKSLDKARGAKDEQTAIPNTDALYTKEKGIVLCVFTADCVPVFFYNKKAGIVGVIHSGWSGTVKEITKKTLEHIKETEKVRMEDFFVYIGSALSKERFEVDDDVYQLFDALGYAEPFISYQKSINKYYIDNQQVVKEQCVQSGILEENITVDPTCTYDNPTGFSYRENKKAGRHLSFIVQK